MYANYLKLALLLAGLMFVTGFICLAVLSATKVLPAQKGLSFEQTTCRITRSEISCDTGNCSRCIRGEGKDVRTPPCLKVYVLCGDSEGAKTNRSFSSDKQRGYLLRRDAYHLNDKVTV